MNPERETISALPTPEQIKGVMRWVIRAALASNVGSHITLRKLNEEISLLLGGIKSEAGGEKKGKVKHFDSLITVEVEAKVKDRQERNIVREVRDTLQDVYKEFHALSEEIFSKYGRFLKRKRNREQKPEDQSWPFDLLEVLGWIAINDYYNEHEQNKQLTTHEIARSLVESWFIKRKSEKKPKNNKDKEKENLVEDIKKYTKKLVEMVEILKRCKDSNNYPWLAAYFTIPRIKLQLMGKGKVEDIVKLLPVPPEVIELKVRVSLKSQRIKHSSKNLSADPKKIGKFIAYALIYVLEVHGIGRGTSRGFGRFRIDESTIVLGEKFKELKNELSNLLKNLHSNNIKEAIEDIHEELSILSREIFKGEVGSDEFLTEVPSLSNSNYKVQVRVFDRPKHPYPYPLRMLSKKTSLNDWYVNNVFEALSAIGYSTLKSVWKVLQCSKHRGKKCVFMRGEKFHTWILGLPRWQGDARTGYASINVIIGKDKRHEVMGLNRSCGEADTEREHEEYYVEIEEKDTLSSDSGLRRVSPIMLYPIDTGNGVKIVLLLFKTLEDHNRALRCESIDFSENKRGGNNKNLCMVHIGHLSPRRRNRTRRGRRREEEVRRVRTVKSILDSEGKSVEQVIHDALSNIKKLLGGSSDA